MTTSTQRHSTLDRNLANEMVRVTESAAMAAGRVLGWDDKELADGLAAPKICTTSPQPWACARAT